MSSIINVREFGTNKDLRSPFSVVLPYDPDRTRAVFNEDINDDELYDFKFWSGNGFMQLERLLGSDGSAAGLTEVTAWYVKRGGTDSTQKKATTYCFSLDKNVFLGVSPISSVTPASVWTPGSSSVETTNTNVSITAKASLGTDDFESWFTLTPGIGTLDSNNSSVINVEQKKDVWLIAKYKHVFWKRIENLGSTRHFRDVAVVSRNEVCIVGGGLLRTTDGGRNWMHNNIEDLGLYCIDIKKIRSLDPRRTSKKYFAVGFRIFETPTMHSPQGEEIRGEATIGKIITSDNGIKWRSLHTVQSVSSISSDISGKLLSVSFINKNTGWVLGKNAIFKTTNGGINWSQYSLPSEPGTLNSIMFINENEGYGVGCDYQGNNLPNSEGAEYRFAVFYTDNGGQTWVSEDIENNTPSSQRVMLNNIAIVGNQRWAVGTGGTILKRENARWISLRSGIEVALTDVAFVTERIGYVVGEDGVILHTADGGENWVLERSGTGEHLTAIALLDENNGWTVGGNGAILYRQPLSLL